MRNPDASIAAQKQIPHSKPWLLETDSISLQSHIQSDSLSSGTTCQSFESAFAGYLGQEACFSTHSGAIAIILALQALGVSYGDEVILPTYVCRSVLQAIKAVGATPVLCDIGPLWNMTMETVSATLTEKTKAIIAVHIFGLPLDMVSLQGLGIPIIEDCCQALGTRLSSNHLVGTLGDFSIFSFHATKCMTTGEGGMIAARNPELIEKLKSLRSEDPRFRPLSDLQASLGLSQLSRYQKILKRRSEIAKQYFNQLPTVLTEKYQSASMTGNYFRFILSIDIPYEKLHSSCSQNGVAIRKGVDYLLHWDAPELSGETHFPMAEATYQRTVSIPIYPALTDSDVSYVCQTLNRAIS